MFASRSQAVQAAVQEKVFRRLAQECAKLDPTEEQTMAEEELTAAE